MSMCEKKKMRREAGACVRVCVKVRWVCLLFWRQDVINTREARAIFSIVCLPPSQPQLWESCTGVPFIIFPPEQQSLITNQ